MQLNAFYIRGYSDAQNLVSSAEEGLARAASQDYAFFAGQRSARSTLRLTCLFNIMSATIAGHVIRIGRPENLKPSLTKYGQENIGNQEHPVIE